MTRILYFQLVRIFHEIFGLEYAEQVKAVAEEKPCEENQDKS